MVDPPILMVAVLRAKPIPVVLCQKMAASDSASLVLCFRICPASSYNQNERYRIQICVYTPLFLGYTVNPFTIRYWIEIFNVQFFSPFGVFYLGVKYKTETLSANDMVLLYIFLQWRFII